MSASQTPSSASPPLASHAPLPFGDLVVCGLVVGLAAGGLIGLFRISNTLAFGRAMAWLGEPGQIWLRAPLWFMVLGGISLIVGRLAKEVPRVARGGIPQIELALEGRLHIPGQAWPRLLLAKFVSAWLVLFGGLSLGREGPSVEMGASVGALVGRRWRGYATFHNPALMAGSAAGFAAAFGSPCAAFVFVFEEMGIKPTWRHALMTAVSVVAADCVVAWVFGLGRLFPFAEPALPSQWWVLVLFGAGLGTVGSVYVRLLLFVTALEVKSLVRLPRLFQSEAVRTLPPLLLAGTLALLMPQVLGEGEALVASLDDPHTLFMAMGLAVLILAIKFGFSIFSYTGAVPAGLLMPILCLGALFGLVGGRMLLAAGGIGPEALPGFIIFGMAGFFAATVRAGLTGFVLVLEITGCVGASPAMALVVATAWGCAILLGCPPLYAGFKTRLQHTLETGGAM